MNGASSGRLRRFRQKQQAGGGRGSFSIATSQQSSQTQSQQQQQQQNGNNSSNSAAISNGVVVSSVVAGDVVAATFANAQLTTTKAALDTYYHKYTEAAAECEMLRDELRQHEGDSLVVISHLESQLSGVLAASAEYRDEVAKVLDSHAAAEAKLKDTHEKMIQERDKQITEYADLTRRLQGDLRQASKYVQQRQEHAMELKQLHEELEEAAMTHERELAALRFQTVDRKMKLVAMEQVMRNEFQNLVEAESTRLLNTKYEVVVQYNHALEKEKYDMAGDIEDLMVLTTTVTNEKNALRRRAELHKHAHEEVLRHAASRSRYHREREVKVQRLEMRVSELLAERTSMKEKLKTEYASRTAALEQELARAQTSVQTYRAELCRVRKLARKVVGQRTELENFFYTAIEDCRKYRAGLNALAAPATTTTITTGASTMMSTRGGFTGTSSSVGASRGGVTTSTTMGNSHHPSSVRQGARQPTTLTPQEQHHQLAATMHANSTFSIARPTLADAVTRGSATMPATVAAAPSFFASGTSTQVGDHGDGVSIVMSAAGVTCKQTGGLPPLRATATSTTGGGVSAVMGGDEKSMSAFSAAATTRKQSQPLAAAPGVYVGDLPWEDKEKVIKALFFYINSTYYRDTPADEGEDGMLDEYSGEEASGGFGMGREIASGGVGGAATAALRP